MVSFQVKGKIIRAVRSEGVSLGVQKHVGILMVFRRDGGKIRSVGGIGSSGGGSKMEAELD